MPAIKVTVTVEVDGVVLDGFPWVRRQTVDQVQSFSYLKADDGDAITFTTLPVDLLTTLQALVLRGTQDVTLRFNGQTDAGLLLKQDGLLVALGVEATAGLTTNATVNNNSGETATLRGLGGGV